MLVNVWSPLRAVPRSGSAPRKLLRNGHSSVGIVFVMVEVAVGYAGHLDHSLE